MAGNVTQRRTGPGEVSMALTERILETNLTLSLKDLASVSRSVQPGLICALKETRDHPTLERNGEGKEDRKPLKEAGKVMKVEIGDGKIKMDPKENQARSPRIDVIIGEVKIQAVVDIGSMINLISRKRAEDTGLAL